MAIQLGIPLEFGGSWQAFSEEWCLNSAVAYNPTEISKALSTLKRLWPDKFAEIASNSDRGVIPAVHAIDHGLVLAHCETTGYFSRVLKRLKSGKWPAFSELVLVAALRRLGYDPVFEVGEGCPDAQCLVDGVNVSFEVYAADDSFASKEQLTRVRALEAAVSGGVSRCRVEIEIHELFGDENVFSVVNVVKSAPDSAWVFVDNWARVRRVDQGSSLPPAFDHDGARIVIGEDADTQGQSEGVIIRWEPSDMRAERKLQEKRGQIDGGVANVVVIDVSAVGGVWGWPDIIAKLHGSDYDKIGATAFFAGGAVVRPPVAVRRRWATVVNPDATHPVPTTLIDGLEALDESSYLGVAQKPRLFFAT